MKNAPILPGYRFALRAALIGAGYKTIKQAAEAMGYTTPTLGHIITGWRYPSPALQSAICRLLGINFEELGKLI